MDRHSVPLVTVIVPTYQRPNLLNRALKSIIDQTYRNIEIIVVNDDPNCDVENHLSEDILNNAKKFELITHEKNRGSNIARNTGIRAASGKYVCFLDDDDLWHQDKIRRQVEIFEKSDDNVGVVYTGQKYVNNNGETTFVQTPEISGNITKKLLTGATMSPFSALMVQANFIDEAGKTDKKLPSLQDHEWCIRLSRVCDFAPIAEPLVIRSMKDHQQITDNFTEKREVTYPRLKNKYDLYCREYNWLFQKKSHSSLKFRIGKAGIKNKEYSCSRNIILSSILEYPFGWRKYAYLFVSIGGEPVFNIAQKLNRYFMSD